MNQQKPTEESGATNEEQLEEEELRVIEEGAVSLSREEFNLLNDVDATDEIWQNFLKEKSLQPNKLYEFHILEEDGTETIRACGTDETREVDGVVTPWDEHLTVHPSETALLLARKKNELESQPEKLDPIERVEIVDQIGVEAVEEVVVDPETEALSVRDRLRAAMDPDGERAPAKEKMMSDEEGQLAQKIMTQMLTVEEGMRNGGVDSVEEAEYHRNAFIATKSLELKEDYAKGVLGKEAYLFITSAFIGAALSKGLMEELLRDIANSDAISDEAFAHVRGQVDILEMIGNKRGEERQQSLGRFSFDTGETLRKLRDANDGQTNNDTYLAILGVSAGAAIHMTSDHASQGVFGTLSYARSLNK